MSLTVKTSLLKFKALSLAAIILLLSLNTACNSKTEETEQIAVTVSTVAVKSFNLKEDTKILSELDSVFFSIDLNKGVIFNADSLPLGTDVSRLIPVITFTSTMTEAKIVVQKDALSADTIDYLKNPNDSIDFTKPVKLNVTAWDNINKYTYTLKVNVHQQKPDSLMWDRLAVSKLPFRKKPAEQKSVKAGQNVFCLVRETDNTYTISRTQSLFNGVWQTAALEPGFTPDVNTLTAVGSDLYVLGTDGSLFTSPDAQTWTATGEIWSQVIGAYGSDVLLGIKGNAGGYIHCHYPLSADISDTAVASDFPMSGRTQLASINVKWAQLPTSLFSGGTKADGTLSNATWAFDGSRWAKIDNNPTPAITGAALVPYCWTVGSTIIIPGTEYSAFLLLGGTLADGTANRKVYVSVDNGVTWKEGGQLTDLPDHLPSLTNLDAIVENHTLDGNLQKSWTSLPSDGPARWFKPEYTLSGYDISWECPYIYLIGGQLPTGILSESIWRGVMAKLTFVPLI